jgi:tetratricopeptide (TPR) repeat protein
MDKDLREQLGEIGDDFQVRILEAALKSDSENFNVLFELGNTYTNTGRYEEGLEIDRKLSRLRPENPVVHYNLACSLSLLQKTDEAFDELELSFKLGYREHNHIISDPDLENLRGDGRFVELLEKYIRSKGKSD